MARMSMTPPMGWNSWNYFGAMDLYEKPLYEIADAMVDMGFVEAGYNILTIDDYWMMSERDENGDLVPNPERFPSGMKAFGDYLHERGIKFGIYAGAGVKTWAGRMGSYGYERQDARKFAEWGVDFLKYDFGYVPPNSSNDILMRRMGQALRESGRDILFAACDGEKNIVPWIKTSGATMWRLCGDIKDSWESILSVAGVALECAEINGPGNWNDPDMMVVGLDGEGYVGRIGGGCTDTEYETHFAVWCMLSAPLLMGHDIRKTRPEIAKILLNRELIAIDQDPLGISATKLPTKSLHDYILYKPLENGDIAFCLVNDTDDPKRMILSWDFCGWDIYDKISLRDVIHHEELGVFTVGKDFQMQPHACMTLRATRL